jgi:hypothetical protein
MPRRKMRAGASSGGCAGCGCQGAALIMGGRRCCQACVKNPKRQLGGKAGARKNPWLKHVTQVFNSGDVTSYKEALIEAKKTYTKKPKK